MSGILATINHKEASLKDALFNMKSRGPDITGSYIYKNLSLGYLHLATHELNNTFFTTGNNIRDRYAIVFNGEIYNHWSLRENELKGNFFWTDSQTETIVAMYDKFREKCVHYLKGAFAFIILDKAEETIFVARDHFGIKPLYYSSDEFEFACASELKALLPYVKDQELDIGSIQAYLTFMWCPGEQTPFKSVKKLLPGSYLKIDIKKLSSFENVRYYKLVFPGKTIKNNFKLTDWINQLEQKLIIALKRQLQSNVPIGFFLSGGLDSSLLVAMARKILPDEQIICYTIDSGASKDGFANDLFYARKVAEYLKVDLKEIIVNPEIVKDFDKIIWHLDEPQADSAPFNVLKICEVARDDGIKVLIGGTGGDDIFSGYRRHQALLLDKYLDCMPRQLRSVFKEGINKIKSNQAWIRRLKKLTKSIDKDKNHRLIGYFEWQSFEYIQGLFIGELQKELSPENDYFLNLLRDVQHLSSDLNKLLYLEIYTFLTGHNLNYTDKIGMAYGVEIKAPFLDLDLVEFSTIIPPQFKMRHKETKYILKKVAERYLPRDVIFRSKTGFGFPLENWVRQELDDFIDNSLSKESIESFAVFDYSAIKELIRDNKNGKINASYILWSLLTIQSWFKQFIKTNSKEIE